MTGAAVQLHTCVANSSTWRTAGPAPEVVDGFQELGTYLFQATGAGWRMLVDDEPLTRSSARPDAWEWSPGFYAGQVRARLEADGRADGPVHFTFDVSPDPQKLGHDIFQAMLDDIRRDEPGLLMGSEPAQSVVGSADRLHDPWLAFARLRSYAPEFLRALKPVTERPRRSLRTTRRHVSLAEARRVDRQTAMVAARSSAASVLRGRAASAGEIRLDVPSIEPTVDCAANRTLLALARSVLQRIRAVRVECAVLVEKERLSETATPLANRWPTRREELDRMERRLVKLLAGFPFIDVRRAEVTAAGLTAVSADPIYARAWGRGWRAIRDGAGDSMEQDAVWLSPTWEIYERWCFLRLRRWLTARYPTWNWMGDSFQRTWRGRGPGVEAELALQPRFPAWSENRGERWSVSRQREPDIVLTVTRGAESKFLVFDAKYRTTRANVLDAMQSAHIYQDSLRLRSARPVGALLLVPAGGGAPWLEGRGFQEDHRVGVVVMTPGNEPAFPGFVGDLLSAHD